MAKKDKRGIWTETRLLVTFTYPTSETRSTTVIMWDGMTFHELMKVLVQARFGDLEKPVLVEVWRA